MKNDIQSILVAYGEDNLTFDQATEQLEALLKETKIKGKGMYKVDGYIQTEVDEDTFNEEFLKFMDYKGWFFAGTTLPYDAAMELPIDERFVGVPAEEMYVDECLLGGEEYYIYHDAKGNEGLVTFQVSDAYDTKEDAEEALEAYRQYEYERTARE